MKFPVWYGFWTRQVIQGTSGLKVMAKRWEASRHSRRFLRQDTEVSRFENRVDNRLNSLLSTEQGMMSRYRNIALRMIFLRRSCGMSVSLAPVKPRTSQICSERVGRKELDSDQSRNGGEPLRCSFGVAGLSVGASRMESVQQTRRMMFPVRSN